MRQLPMPRKREPPPELPPENAAGSRREQIALWMKERIDSIASQYEERIELLRQGGEHPNPVHGKMVKKFAMLGISKSQIAKLLEIGMTTIVTYYEDEFDRGIAEGNAAVAMTMLHIATDPTNPQAGKVGMSWLDRRGGDEWAGSAKKVQIEDKRTAPMIDSSKMTFEERQTMRAMLTRITEGGEGEPLRDGEGESEIGEEE